MNKKAKYLMDLIFDKLKRNKYRKINLEKDEFSKFINFLINKH